MLYHTFASVHTVHRYCVQQSPMIFILESPVIFILESPGDAQLFVILNRLFSPALVGSISILSGPPSVGVLGLVEQVVKLDFEIWCIVLIEYDSRCPNNPTFFIINTIDGIALISNKDASLCSILKFSSTLSFFL